MALFRRKKNNVVGLDIGSRTIKLAEVAEAKKGFILKKFGMIDISPGLIEDGTIKNPEATPIWFNEEFKKEEISDEDKKELEELMKGYQ